MTHLKRKLRSCVHFLKNGLRKQSETMRQASVIFWCGNFSSATHVTLLDTPNNRAKHCLIKLRTPKHIASDMQSMLQRT